MLLVLVFGLVLLNGAGITIWLNGASTSIWFCFVGAKSRWFVTKCVLHDMSEAPMSP